MESKRLNRSRSIRKKCLDCCVGQENEVRECVTKHCHLWEYRMGKNPKEPKQTKVKAIRLKCLDCSGFSYLEVKNCPITDCPIYRFRLGAEEK